MNKLTLLLILFLLTGCSISFAKDTVESKMMEPENPVNAADLPNYGSAPELNNEVWLNSDKPLRLGELRGKVVLLEMWTFG